MPNNDLFSGIPALDDSQGLESIINQQTLDSMGVSSQIPTALEQSTDPNAQQPTEPAQQLQNSNIPYTSEQISQIVERNQQLEAAIRQSQAQQVQQQQQQPLCCYLFLQQI
jgi:hypothetical protein